MKKPLLAFLVFGAAWLLPGHAPAQDTAPYLLPQTIFVGDSGRLVVPLGAAYVGAPAFVLDGSGTMPEAPDLEFKRIELERRGNGARLLVDFVPYAPGVLKFPPLDPLSLAGTAPEYVPGERSFPPVTDLEVTVASILNPQEMTLSEPAAPLAVPGTSLLIYGTLALVLVLFLLGIGGSIWGRRHFRAMWEYFHRRHLLRSMARFLARVRHQCNADRNIDSAHYLSLLSGELREFLSSFTGVNCQPLSAPEFVNLSLRPRGRKDAAENGGSKTPGFAVIARNGGKNPGSEVPAGENPGAAYDTGPAFLCRLFHTWDTLRFSGRRIDRVDLFLALKETDSFLGALDRAEREKPLGPARDAGTAPQNREKFA